MRRFKKFNPLPCDFNDDRVGHVDQEVGEGDLLVQIDFKQSNIFL